MSFIFLFFSITSFTNSKIDFDELFQQGYTQYFSYTSASYAKSVISKGYVDPGIHKGKYIYGVHNYQRDYSPLFIDSLQFSKQYFNSKMIVIWVPPKYNGAVIQSAYGKPAWKAIELTQEKLFISSFQEFSRVTKFPTKELLKALFIIDNNHRPKVRGILPMKTLIREVIPILRKRLKENKIPDETFTFEMPRIQERTINLKKYATMWASKTSLKPLSICFNSLLNTLFLPEQI